LNDTWGDMTVIVVATLIADAGLSTGVAGRSAGGAVDVVVAGVPVAPAGVLDVPRSRDASTPTPMRDGPSVNR
jgi:hypothetical protein